MEHAKKITKRAVIGSVLDEHPEVAPFFMEMGMHCLGCPSSRSESIADACAIHATNADEFVDKINSYIVSKNG